jgi:hypothetical protein
MMPQPPSENAAPESIPERDEVEVTHLERAGGARRRAPLPGPPASRIGRRLWRLGGVLALALGIVLLLNSAAFWQSLLSGRFGNGPFTAPPVGAFPTVTPLPNAVEWLRLERRPLALPSIPPGTTCPVTPRSRAFPAVGPAVGAGPVYVAGANIATGTLGFVDGRTYASTATPWGGTLQFWAGDSTLHEAVLVRGRQLDGSRPLAFNGGLQQPNYSPQDDAATPLPDLWLLGDGYGYNAYTGLGIQYTRMQAPGCYGYQIDGASFSEAIIFRAATYPATS